MWYIINKEGSRHRRSQGKGRAWWNKLCHENVLEAQDAERCNRLSCRAVCGVHARPETRLCRPMPIGQSIGTRASERECPPKGREANLWQDVIFINFSFFLLLTDSGTRGQPMFYAMFPLRYAFGLFLLSFVVGLVII